MKHILIFLCILIVGALAYVDAKDRIEELDEVAANTPSQVEMNQSIKSPPASGINQNRPPIEQKIYTDSQKAKDKVQQDKQYLQNKFDDFQKKRDTITNPVQ